MNQNPAPKTGREEDALVDMIENFVDPDKKTPETPAPTPTPAPQAPTPAPAPAPEPPKPAADKNAPPAPASPAPTPEPPAPTEPGAPPVVTNVTTEDDSFTDIDSLEKGIKLTEDSEETKKKTEELKIKQELQQWNDLKPIIQGDPIIDAYVQYKKNGGVSWSDFQRNIAGDDLSTLSEEQIFAYAATNLEGIKEQEAHDDFVQSMMGLSDSMRQREISKIKSAVDFARNERVKQFGLDLRSKEEIRKEHQAVGRQTLDTFCTSIEGKKFHGMVISPEVNKAIKEAVINDFAYYDPREGFRVKDSWNFHFWKLFAKDVMAIRETNVRHATTAAVVDSVVAPSANTAPSNSTVAFPVLTEQERVKEAGKGVFNGMVEDPY